MQDHNLKSMNTEVPNRLSTEGVREKAINRQENKVAQGISCVLARNAKVYTGPGTNTYIVGDDSVWIIDPGPRDSLHIDAVLATVAGRPVIGVLVTHSHMDHSGAAQELAEKTGTKTYGFGCLCPQASAQTDEEIDTNFTPDVCVTHGETLGAGAWRLKALHTPGHFPNHLCFLLPEVGVLFSGDHVMGWSTTVVMPPLGNMAAYIESLAVLEACDASLMLPSHGPLVAQPNERIEAIRKHRLMRHRQVAECIASGVAEPFEIVKKLYEGLTPHLLDAAQGCVRAHIEMLQNDA